MSALHSSVLVIGHPEPETMQFGADFVDNFEEAKALIPENAYRVVVFPSENNISQACEHFLELLEQKTPSPQRIPVALGADPPSLKTIVNKGHVFKILSSFTDDRLEPAVQQALEQFDFSQQRSDLLNLVNEQNEKLKTLQTELEERVKKRQKYLDASKKRLMITNQRLQAIHDALMAVHRASSVGQMEKRLNEALAGPLDLEWTRIVFSSQSSLQTQLNDTKQPVFRVPLATEEKQLGTLYFARPQQKKFKKDERDFLHQIADAVTLAIDRISKLEASESLKQQWEATFDAISEPLCLMNSKQRIVRTNKAFCEQTGLQFSQLVGRDAFKAFLDRENILPVSGKVESMIIPHNLADGSESFYQVTSHPLGFKLQDDDMFLVMFRDVTEQQRLERQLLETTKMAEIGTISSSIAHELNNPVGGIISFLQLIKSDVENDADKKEDIGEMEAAAQKCKEIIENLLGFSRRQDNSTFQEVDVRDVIYQSLKITELQSRPRGINVELNLPEEQVLTYAQSNSLAQALHNLLQNATDAVLERKSSEERFQGQIDVYVQDSEDECTIDIIDNGLGITEENKKNVFNPLFTTKDPNLNSGLGLTVAFKIITDHQGRLEISSQRSEGTKAKIALPRTSMSQVFDTEN